MAKSQENGSTILLVILASFKSQVDNLLGPMKIGPKGGRFQLYLVFLAYAWTMASALVGQRTQ